MRNFQETLDDCVNHLPEKLRSRWGRRLNKPSSTLRSVLGACYKTLIFPVEERLEQLEEEVRQLQEKVNSVDNQINNGPKPADGSY